MLRPCRLLILLCSLCLTPPAFPSTDGTCQKLFPSRAALTWKLGKRGSCCSCGYLTVFTRSPCAQISGSRESREHRHGGSRAGNTLNPPTAPQQGLVQKPIPHSPGDKGPTRDTAAGATQVSGGHTPRALLPPPAPRDPPGRPRPRFLTASRPLRAFSFPSQLPTVPPERGEAGPASVMMTMLTTMTMGINDGSRDSCHEVPMLHGS